MLMRRRRMFAGFNTFVLTIAQVSVLIAWEIYKAFIKICLIKTDKPPGDL